MTIRIQAKVNANKKKNNEHQKKVQVLGHPAFDIREAGVD